MEVCKPNANGHFDVGCMNRNHERIEAAFATGYSPEFVRENPARGRLIPAALLAGLALAWISRWGRAAPSIVLAVLLYAIAGSTDLLGTADLLAVGSAFLASALLDMVRRRRG